MSAEHDVAWYVGEALKIRRKTLGTILEMATLITDAKATLTPEGWSEFVQHVPGKRSGALSYIAIGKRLGRWPSERSDALPLKPSVIGILLPIADDVLFDLMDKGRIDSTTTAEDARRLIRELSPDPTGPARIPAEDNLTHPKDLAAENKRLVAENTRLTVENIALNVRVEARDGEIQRLRERNAELEGRRSADWEKGAA